MLSQRSLEAFRAVMLTGTVSAAAEEMNVSQPAVSRLIRELEERTGLRLFTRHGGRIVATAEAHEFWTEVERGFQGLLSIERTAREIRLGRRSSVSVVSMPALSQTILPDAFARLHAQIPDFRLEFLSMRTQNVVRHVAARQSRLGFTAPTRHVMDVDMVTTMALPYRCVMPAGHPLAALEVVTLDDLAGRDFVGFTESTATGRMLDRLFAPLARPPVVRVRAQISPVVSALVLRGLGVGVIDPFCARDHARRGGISRPFQAEDKFQLAIIKAHGDKLSSDFLALIDIFEELTRSY
jgi:DNA-binding transcriptional LysR family regulator